MKNNIFVLEVEGDAMAPNVLEGDLLTVDMADKPKSNGKDLSILIVDGKLHVCRYTRFGKQILMIHDNAPIIAVANDKVEVLGKVIEQKENLSAGHTKAS